MPITVERAIARPSVDELLTPFRRQVADSGMTDEELDEFHRDLPAKVRSEKKAPVVKPKVVHDTMLFFQAATPPERIRAAVWVSLSFCRRACSPSGPQVGWLHFGNSKWPILGFFKALHLT